MPCAPSVGGIGLLRNVKAESPVSFVKRLQISPMGQVIPLDGSQNCVEFFEDLIPIMQQLSN